MKPKTFALALLSLLPSAVVANDAPDLTGIKCIVMGQRAANIKYAVEYRDGSVYLCCPRCQENFSGDVEKYSTKANHQLVVTGQYIQTACPSGAKIEDVKFKLNVAGVEIAFSSKEERAKVADQPDIKKKVELVFANKLFKKAFRKKNSDDLAEARYDIEPDPHQTKW